MYEKKDVGIFIFSCDEGNIGLKTSGFWAEKWFTFYVFCTRFGNILYKSLTIQFSYMYCYFFQ